MKDIDKGRDGKDRKRKHATLSRRKHSDKEKGTKRERRSKRKQYADTEIKLKRDGRERGREINR